MTVSDKLSKINQIKNSIRNAANSKGAEISESDSFEVYPEKIEAIPESKAELLDFSKPVPIGMRNGKIVYKQIVDTQTYESRSLTVYLPTYIDRVIEYSVYIGEENLYMLPFISCNSVADPTIKGAATTFLSSSEATLACVMQFIGTIPSYMKNAPAHIVLEFTMKEDEV